MIASVGLFNPDSDISDSDNDIEINVDSDNDSDNDKRDSDIGIDKSDRYLTELYRHEDNTKD